MARKPMKPGEAKNKKIQVSVKPHEFEALESMTDRHTSLSELSRDLILAGLASTGLVERLRPRRTVYRLLGAGSAAEWREQTDVEPPGEVDLLDWHDGDYILTVEGECLAPDGVFSGDLIHVTPNLQPQNGDIVVATGKDSHGRFFATIKHYHPLTERGRQMIELQPSDDNFPTIKARAEDVAVQGVVVGLARRSLRQHFQFNHLKRPYVRKSAA